MVPALKGRECDKKEEDVKNMDTDQPRYLTRGAFIDNI